MLRFREYKKSYGRSPVLSCQALEVPAGLYWIKGKNGSGKSTLLKTVAGILSFEGDIALHGISIKRHPVAYRQRVNFAEAEPIFPEFLTGQEMINLFVSAKSATDAQAEKLARSIQLYPYLQQTIGSYSSGMLKKLSLILAFLGKPDVILLDEPLITLDTDSLDTLSHWITDAYRQNQTSFFLSSHQSLHESGFQATGTLHIEGQSIHLS
jgi:ABC-2 type transport system ATP-binding protein